MWADDRHRLTFEYAFPEPILRLSNTNSITNSGSSKNNNNNKNKCVGNATIFRVLSVFCYFFRDASAFLSSLQAKESCLRVEYNAKARVISTDTTYMLIK